MNQWIVSSNLNKNIELDKNQTIPSIQEYSLKRVVDLILASVMLVFSAPILLIVSLAIVLESGRPVFFKQKRWGFQGKKFLVWKFRTMIPDAGNHQAKKSDPRVTKVGGLLRAIGIDELPQIINILEGSMSFVGPRPLAVDEVILNDKEEEITYEEVPGFWKRMSVRPGLTSMATVYERKDIHPTRKFHYDIRYIRNQSFWLDLKLIILSFWISMRGKWESREEKV